MNKIIKINLGAGKKYLDGYINCDVVTEIKADKYFNLDKPPYPFKDDSADEVLMDNALEHVQEIAPVFGEVYRILKNNGILRIYVPYIKSDGAFQDPTHKHFFTEHTMDYFTKEFDYNYYTKIRFSKVKAELFCDNKTPLSKIRYLIPFKNILKHFLFNIYDGIYFELRAIKEK